MRVFALAFLACSFACGGDDGASSEAVTLSRSKLGVQVMASANDVSAKALVGACPRVAKWILPATGASAAIARYKQQCSGGSAVIRVFVPRTVHYATTESASSAADDFWSRMQPDLATIDPNDVDWLEGPNEIDNLPNWCLGGQASTWFASFWSRLADDMNAAGYSPLVGSIAPRCAAHSTVTLSTAAAAPAGTPARPVTCTSVTDPRATGPPP